MDLNRLKKTKVILIKTSLMSIVGLSSVIVNYNYSSGAFHLIMLSVFLGGLIYALIHLHHINKLIDSYKKSEEDKADDR